MPQSREFPPAESHTNLKLKGKRGFLKETQSSKLLGKNFKNHWCSFLSKCSTG